MQTFKSEVETSSSHPTYVPREKVTRRELLMLSLFTEAGEEPVFFVHPTIKMRFGSPSEAGFEKLTGSLKSAGIETDLRDLYPARYHTMWHGDQEVGILAGRSMLSMTPNALSIHLHVDLIHLLDRYRGWGIEREMGRGFAGQAQMVVDNDALFDLGFGHRCVEVTLSCRGNNPETAEFMRGCNDSLFSLEDMALGSHLDFGVTVKHGLQNPPGVWG